MGLKIGHYRPFWMPGDGQYRVPGRPGEWQGWAGVRKFEAPGAFAGIPENPYASYSG
jgi:hypothetical protein